MSVKMLNTIISKLVTSDIFLFIFGTEWRLATDKFSKTEVLSCLEPQTLSSNSSLHDSHSLNYLWDHPDTLLSSTIVTTQTSTQHVTESGNGGMKSHLHPLQIHNMLLNT